MTISYTVRTTPATTRTLSGWLTQNSKLPAGGQRQSPDRKAYHSANGKFLGATVTPTAEMVMLAISGIPASELDSMRLLISALASGQVDFTISSPLTTQTFTAWAEGEIGQPTLRRGAYYDWDLKLRVAV